MKKRVVTAAFAGLSLTVAGVGHLMHVPAMATELDGFAIHTQDKAVTVTLYTDQRAQYTTENNGKQFAIILPDTKLSQEQMNNGLPVVIDNKNRFIGRAVPTEDGQVKIILPNLPANDYAVSVQQKRPGQADSPPPALKPHAVVSASGESHFEQVAASFPKQGAASQTPSTSSTGFSGVRLSAPPIKAGNGTIWNPYVVKAPSVPSMGNSAYSHYKPVHNPPRRRHVPPPITEAPLNTVSVAESSTPAQFGQGFNNPDFNPSPTPPAFGGATTTLSIPDSLANLHQLQVDPARVPFDNLKGLAQESPFIPTNLIPPRPQQPTAPAGNPFSDLKDAVLGLPQWLLITAAVFLGGMGIFTLFGGLVLLRLLFTQARSGLFGAPAQPTIIVPPGFQFSMDANGNPVFEAGKSPYASQPEAARLSFEDKASVNALDYLKTSADNVSQAVHNSVLIKFPGQRKPTARRTGTRGRTNHRAPAYGR